MTTNRAATLRHPGRFAMKADGDRAEIMLYDVIGGWDGVTPKQFAADLKALGDVKHIDLRIHSPGGSIFDGMAIYSVLKRHGATITAHVDGIAASMASVVAMAAGEIVMAAGSYMMIHNPLGWTYGEAGDLREYADLLDKMKGQIVALYAARTGREAEEISALMDAETWMTADEAVQEKFADRITGQAAATAALDLSRFTNLPTHLQGAIAMATKNEPTAPPEKTAAELKAELVAANQDYVSRFGAELAAKWGPLGEGKPIIDCYAEFTASLKAGHEAALQAKDDAHAAAVAELTTKLEAATKKATEAEERLASLSLGEKAPVSGGEPKKPEGGPVNGLPAGLAKFAAGITIPEKK